jgi:DNA phosphorothioation-associated putative methyltransferase
MIDRWRTAIGRLTASKPAQAAYTAGLVFGRCLDYGCGRGRDVQFFREHAQSCDGYDPGRADWCWPPHGKYDFIHCGYVLNVIEEPAERMQVLTEIRGHLQANGRALIVVRGPGSIEPKANWRVWGDGWITPANTFQRTFTRYELEVLVRHAGLHAISESYPDIRLPKRMSWAVVSK